MWDQVGQALSQSMNRMLSQMASLLPGVVALIAALLVSFCDRWALALFCGDRSRVSIFDRPGGSNGVSPMAEWSARQIVHAAGHARGGVVGETDRGFLIAFQLDVG